MRVKRRLCLTRQFLMKIQAESEKISTRNNYLTAPEIEPEIEDIFLVDEIRLSNLGQSHAERYITCILMPVFSRIYLYRPVLQDPILPDINDVINPSNLSVEARKSKTRSMVLHLCPLWRTPCGLPSRRPCSRLCRREVK